MHGTSLTVVDYHGAPPPPELAGLKDSLVLPAGTTATIAVPFGNHSDPEHPYMFHCHLLAHDEHGIMGQFVVTPLTEPGLRQPD